MIFGRHFGFFFNECRVATSQHTSNKPGPDRIDNVKLSSRKANVCKRTHTQAFSHITPQTPSTSVLLCCFNIVLPFKHQVGLNVLWHKRREKELRILQSVFVPDTEQIERKNIKNLKDCTIEANNKSTKTQGEGKKLFK